MDDNFLDDLLNDVSKNEKNNDFDKSVSADSGVDIDLSDLGDISLEELDSLDDLDFSDIDVDDIDFDDVDITNLDSKASAQNSSDDISDNLNLDDLITEAKEESATKDFVDNDNSVADNQDIDALLSSGADIESADDIFGEVNTFDEYDDSQNVDSFEESSVGAGFDSDIDFSQENSNDDMQQGGLQETSDEDVDYDNMDLDDLFSALGIEDESTGEGVNDVAEADDLDALLSESMSNGLMDPDLADIDDLDDVEEKPKKKKAKKEKGEKLPKGEKPPKGEKKAKEGKKTLKEILFGEMDEDDIQEEEEFAAKKEQKQIKKEQQKAVKDAKKEEKNEKKKEKQLIKEQQKQKEKAEKDEKKQQEEKEYLEELEKEKNNKKVSNLTIIIVFGFFAILGAGVFVGSKEFNYTQIIQRAADYFGRQRYRLAYDEVSGVEVKPKDEELKDQIYTVMYVERLYESYNNNMRLHKYDKALDALLRGVGKYDEHYDEAVVLGVLDDLNVCRVKIIDALQNDFGVNEERAYELMELSGKDYINTLRDICKKYGNGE